MPTKYDTTLRQAVAQAIVDALNAAAGVCTIEFYTGAQPATPETAITDQVLLGVVTCSDDVAAAAGGVVTFNPIAQDDQANAGGQATWARLRDGAGVARGDFPVTDNAGAGPVKMNTTTIVAAGPISVESFTIAVGGA